VECHEGAAMIKTFRGMIADGSQDTIVLHTNDGSMGYRIVKFQIIPNQPFDKDQESVIKIYKVSQSSVDTLIDFSDNTLLAVGITTNENIVGTGYMMPMQIIFDQEIFNQDIYVTHKDQDNAEVCNYYLELEQVKLSLDESTVATLKDVRNKELRTMIA